MPPEAPLKPATVHSNTEFSPGLLTTPNTSELYIAQSISDVVTMPKPQTT